MVVKKIKISECGCTQFSLDCKEAQGYWSRALNSRKRGRDTAVEYWYRLYRAHKQQKVRPKVTADTA